MNAEADGNGFYRPRWNPDDGGNGGLRRGWWVEEKDTRRVPYSGLRNRERAEEIANRLNDDPCLPEDFVLLDAQDKAAGKAKVREQVRRVESVRQPTLADEINARMRRNGVLDAIAERLRGNRP